jgi:hypothetical protein
MKAHSAARPAVVLAAGFFLSMASVLPAAADGTIAPIMTCTNLTSLTLPNAQILSATEQSTPVSYCAVIGIINKRTSTQDPDGFTYGIGFQLNLPDAWVGRFEMEGGGGTDGSLGGTPMGEAGVELSQGWAVANDDGGHEDAPGNATLGGYVDDDPNAGNTAHFGVDEQARIDYGYNGISATTAIVKEIIGDYYGQAPDFSYLWGCSNGGRDGIVAAQRIPDAFNGIVSGNPGFDLPRAAVAEAWNEQALAPLATSLDSNGVPFVGNTLQPQDLEVASAAILKACDALDGLVDGIIDNYAACTTARVNAAFKSFTCASAADEHNGSCLTTAQIAALNKIMGGPHTSSGLPLYSSWFWDAGIWDPPSAFGLGFAAWNVAFFGPPGVNTAANLTLGAGAIPMIFTTPPAVLPLVNPNATPSSDPGDSLEGFVFAYNFNNALENIFGTAPGYSESAMEFMTGTRFGPSPNLSAFKHNGGKLIIYDSVNDGIFSAVDLIDYYKEVNLFTGHAPDFARLFLIPNMAHCGGGPATSSFSNNLLAAITAWVESGTAPSQIVAANTNTTSPFPSGGLFDPRVAENFPTNGTRPICPYPQQTRYNGSGATNVAANFHCATPGPFSFFPF